MKIAIDQKKCSGCGTCAEVCPVQLYEVKNGKSAVSKAKKTPSKGSVSVSDSGDCIGCRACEAQCPEAALKVTD